MYIGFTEVNDLKELRSRKINAYIYYFKIDNNRLIRTFYPRDFKTNKLLTINDINNDSIIIGYYPIDLLIDAIIVNEQVYLKSDNYYVYADYMLKYEEFSKELFKKDKDLLKIDATLIIDLINKYAYNKDCNIFILKLKQKYYINLITPNYYYIFRFKDNNFKLIKTFKLLNRFALDRKNNLYFINGIMQFYKVSESFKSYKEFVDILNNNYYKCNNIINFDTVSKKYITKYYCIKYKHSYKKNTVNFNIAKIYFDEDIIMDIDKSISLKIPLNNYFYVAFTI